MNVSVLTQVEDYGEIGAVAEAIYDRAKAEVRLWCPAPAPVDVRARLRPVVVERPRRPWFR